MKYLDLLRMSSSNLWKRKVRTVLTVLGVVIGVASIVVMVSLGLGLSRSLMEQYESYGSLTQIEVNEPWGDTSEEVKRLDQAFYFFRCQRNKILVIFCCHNCISLSNCMFQLFTDGFCKKVLLGTARNSNNLVSVSDTYHQSSSLRHSLSILSRKCG